MFTITDLMELFIDPDMQEFKVYSNSKEEVIFEGFLDDLPENLEYATVTSIDPICDNVFCLNIDDEE